jgi:atypical dual specificity phosphatase
MSTLRPSLSLCEFGVGFGDRVVLHAVSFELPAVGMTVLVGPAGGGKSTLLRTVAGLNDCHPSLSTWGNVRLDDGRRPALVMQHARFFLDTVRENLVSALPNRGELSQLEQTRVVSERLEASGLGGLAARIGCNVVELPLALQRTLAIVRALMSAPRVLFADEPTAGLEEKEAEGVLEMLLAQARERAVLLVTHNQRSARAAGGTTLLLANGRIRERAPTSEFFDQPSSETARHFLRTGGCLAHSPEPVPDEQQPAAPQMTVHEPRSRFLGPRGFYWVLPGKLGGMPRPGIIDELEHDLQGLERLGVTVLVTLEEEAALDASALARRRLRVFHFPVVDMGVPALASTVHLCGAISHWLQSGDVVALHCRAGLGRTGTLLACQLVWSGASAVEAIEAIRSINPRCIQSETQIEFLRSFATWLGENAAARSQDPQIRRQSVTEKGDPHT